MCIWFNMWYRDFWLLVTGRNVKKKDFFKMFNKEEHSKKGMKLSTRPLEAFLHLVHCTFLNSTTIIIISLIWLFLITNDEKLKPTFSDAFLFSDMISDVSLAEKKFFKLIFTEAWPTVLSVYCRLELESTRPNQVHTCKSDQMKPSIRPFRWLRVNLSLALHPESGVTKSHRIGHSLCILFKPAKTV